MVIRVGDTALLTGRSLRHITRSPDTIITTTIMPIAFMLLFVYVFGGAISPGSGSAKYVTTPGRLGATPAEHPTTASHHRRRQHDPRPQRHRLRRRMPSRPARQRLSLLFGTSSRLRNPDSRKLVDGST